MPQTAYADLVRRIKDASILGSCASVLDWDEQTYMPPQGSQHRAEQMSLVAKMSHALLTAPAIGDLLGTVEKADLVREPEAAPAVNVREIRRAYDRATKLPERLVEEIARTTTPAQSGVTDTGYCEGITVRSWLAPTARPVLRRIFSPDLRGAACAS